MVPMKAPDSVLVKVQYLVQYLVLMKEQSMVLEMKLMIERVMVLVKVQY